MQSLLELLEKQMWKSFLKAVLYPSATPGTDELTLRRAEPCAVTQVPNVPGLSLATRPLEKSPGVGEVRLSRLWQCSHLFCCSSCSQ